MVKRKLTTLELNEEDIINAKKYGVNISYYSRLAVGIAIENAKKTHKEIVKELSE